MKSFANEQIVIKSYKFLHYSPCEMESRARFMACDKKQNTSGSFASWRVRVCVILMVVLAQSSKAATDYTRFKVTAIKAKEALMNYDLSQTHLLL